MGQFWLLVGEERVGMVGIHGEVGGGRWRQWRARGLQSLAPEAMALGKKRWRRYMGR